MYTHAHAHCHRCRSRELPRGPTRETCFLTEYTPFTVFLIQPGILNHFRDDIYPEITKEASGATLQKSRLFQKRGKKKRVKTRVEKAAENRSQRQRRKVRKSSPWTGHLTVPGARTSAVTVRPRSRRNTVSCGIRRRIVARRRPRRRPRRPRRPPSSRARRGSPAAS